MDSAGHFLFYTRLDTRTRWLMLSACSLANRSSVREIHLIQFCGSPSHFGLTIADLCSCSRLVESRVNNFFSPDLLSSSLWTGSEVFVSFIKIAINRPHAFFGRLVIAIVDYCSGHSAEHR